MTMFRYGVLSLLILALLGSPLHAEPPTLATVVAAVEAPFKQGSAVALKDLQARFIQQSQIATLDQTQEATGQLWLQYDRDLPPESLQTRFRWIYTEPLEQVFVSNGLTIWVYLPDNNQVILSEAVGLDQQPGMLNPVTLLTGLGELSRDFDVAWAEPRATRDGDYRVRLTPRMAPPYLTSIELTVSRVPLGAQGAPYFPLTGLTVIDPNDNRTEIWFRDPKVNEGVDPTLFLFDPPAGVDILRPEDINPGG